MGIAQRRVSIRFGDKSSQWKSCKSLPVSIQALGDWIKAKRMEKNLTPGHLALKMGIATALILSWESGTCEPDERQKQILGNLLAFRAGYDLRKSG